MKNTWIVTDNLTSSQFLLGMPFYVVFVQLPQRFQSVNFTSAERAGILLLPVTLMTPVGAMTAGLLAKKAPSELVLIMAVAIVLVGTGLLSSLPIYSTFWVGTYGYEVITGFGLGLASAPYFLLMGTSIPEKDMPVATGALNMFRTLGGCVAIAICSAVHRESLNAKLPKFLAPEQVSAARGSSRFIALLPEDVRASVGAIFGRSYNRQFQVMLAFGGLNLLITIILALVRKRLGVFGKQPERKEGNEFMKAPEQPSDGQIDGGGLKDETSHITTVQSTRPEHNVTGVDAIEQDRTTTK